MIAASPSLFAGRRCLQPPAPKQPPQQPRLTLLSFVVFNALTAGFNYQPLDDSAPRAPDLLQLTRLAALRHLTITHRPSLYQQEREYEFDRQGVLPLPAPASFPALEYFHVSFRQDEWYSWASA